MLTGDVQLGGDAVEDGRGIKSLLEGGGEERNPPMDMKKTVNTKSRAVC